MDNKELKEALLRGDRDRLIEEVAKEYVESINDELEAQQSQMVTKEMLMEREKKQMEENLSSKENDEELAKAFIILGEDAGDFITEKEKNLIHEIVEAFSSNILREKCEDPKSDLIKELEQKELWQFFGLQTKHLDALNSLAAKYLENVEGDRAYSLYCLLTLLDAGQPHFWHGMGLAQVMRDKVHESIPLYDRAFSLNKKDVGPLLSKIYAYITLDQKNLAEDVLRQALDVMEQHPQEDPTYATELESLAEAIKTGVK